MLFSREKNQNNLLIPKHGGYYRMRFLQGRHARNRRKYPREPEKTGWIILWLAGVPILILILLYLVRS